MNGTSTNWNSQRINCKFWQIWSFPPIIMFNDLNCDLSFCVMLYSIFTFPFCILYPKLHLFLQSIESANFFHYFLWNPFNNLNRIKCWIKFWWSKILIYLNLKFYLIDFEYSFLWIYFRQWFSTIPSNFFVVFSLFGLC
jgi:hypothetical protein